MPWQSTDWKKSLTFFFSAPEDIGHQARMCAYNKYSSSIHRDCQPCHLSWQRKKEDGGGRPEWDGAMSVGTAFILQRLVPHKLTSPGGDWYGLDNCLLLSKAVCSSSGGRLRTFLTCKMGKMVLKIRTKTLRMIHSQSSTSNTKNKRNIC